MTQTCPAAHLPRPLPGAEPLWPNVGSEALEGFWEHSLLRCVFCMKVFGEEAGARLGAHVLLPLEPQRRRAVAGMKAQPVRACAKPKLKSQKAGFTLLIVA